MPIIPTIGRVVWFYSLDHRKDDQPLAAMIAYVHKENSVNLAVFDSIGQPWSRTNTCIRLLQDDEQPPWGSSFCMWPVIQKTIQVPPVQHEKKKK